jgi:integrase
MEEFAGDKIPSWHFHDLRRTFRSHARRLGIERDVAELMLNHKRKGVEGVYDRNEELELRAAGFAAWEAFLLGLAMSVGGGRRLNIPAPAD